MFDTVASLCFIAGTLPFVIAVAVSLRRSSRPKSVDDYFVYQGKLPVRDFQVTSVGYGLQVAAIILFFWWGTSFGYWSLIVPFTWLFGYLLMGFAVHFGMLDSVLRLGRDDGRQGTIVSLIVEGSGAYSQLLSKLIGLLLITALGATAITELDYATQLIAPIFVEQDMLAAASIVVQVSILAFTLFYVLWGGYRAVVATDEVQVPLSVLFFLLTAVLSLVSLAKDNVDGLSVPVAFLVFISIAGVIVARFWLHKIQPTLGNKLYLSVVGLLALGLVFYCLYSCFSGQVSFEIFRGTDTSSPLGFGVLGAVSLALANSLWQFVDLTSLQRLQSVEFQFGEDEDKSRRSVSHSLFFSGLESSALWTLAASLGILFASHGLDPTSLTESFGSLGNWGAVLLVPILVFVIVSFAVSTIDGYLSAVAFVFFYNVGSLASTANGAESQPSLKNARWATGISIIALYAVYMVVRQLLAKDGEGSPELVAKILYAIYALQLACFPVFIVRLTRGRVHALWALASILSGLFAAFLVTFTPPPTFIDQNSWTVIPPFMSLAVSTVVYLYVIIGKGRNNIARGDVR